MSTTLRRLTLAAVIAAVLPMQAFAADGQVASLIGEVTALRGTQQVVLDPGDEIQSRDTITTGTDSIIRFRMSDESYFAMPANSSLRVDAYDLPKKVNNTTGRAFFSLLKGGFRTVTGLLGKISHDSYKVVTPVATLGVRGTEYSVFYTPPERHTQSDGGDKNGSLALMVISGTVSVTFIVNGVATTVYVTEGKSLVIEVVFDKNGNVVPAAVPVVSDEKPAVFSSGENGQNNDPVFNEKRAIDKRSPGEIRAPLVPGPGNRWQDLPTIPQPPRLEPPASPS